ncbi:50S ribosomal protein L18 [Candidatus Parcubacteria bacterium]|nr:MAG: 50S ribosomal protein L18 [Candidatus Parcubacteria bacterium]
MSQKKIKHKRAALERRRKRVRAKIGGTKQHPRLSVFRSNQGMYLQLIDDTSGKTLASAHSREVKREAKKVEVAFELGKLIAQRAQEVGIKEVVFDRGGRKYHGRVKAVAEGAREAGLKF